jgi:hypothetical protein
MAAVMLWLCWALFSETRHNHGFWVALLLPLSPVIIPLLWLIYLLVKYSTWLVFLLRGRRAEHQEFMRKFRVWYGVFMLF